MIRRLFTLAAALSLLVCIAAGVLWVRSYFTPDDVEAGYWHYQQHENFEKYFDAWNARAFSIRGRLVMGVYLRECVAGPGRWEATPGQRGKHLSAMPTDPRELQGDLREFE